MTPHLRLLGPVQVEHAPGPRPDAPERVTELIAFLALHPWHNGQLLDNALWPGRAIAATTRNRPTNQARTWLGTTAEGTPHVCLVADGGYALAPTMTVDWRQFQQLTDADLTATPTDTLRRALRLVTGQPLSGVNPVRYRWGEGDRADMIEAVADVAVALAARAAHEGNQRTVAWAAAKGLIVEPAHEPLWRYALVAAAKSGVPDRLEQVVAQLHATLDPIGGPERPTRNLIRRLRTHSSSAPLTVFEC